MFDPGALVRILWQLVWILLLFIAGLFVVVLIRNVFRLSWRHRPGVDKNPRSATDPTLDPWTTSGQRLKTPPASQQRFDEDHDDPKSTDQ